jgi:hypothetical protein
MIVCGPVKGYLHFIFYSFGALDPGDGGPKLLQNVWKNLPVDRV